MARTGARARTCALLVAVLLCPLVRGGDDPEKRFSHQLGVQAALEQGLGHLKRKDYQAAVGALEKQIAYIDGNGRYLQALREAYKGHVRELQLAGKSKEADRYRTRLAILEPSTELNKSAALNPPITSDLPARPTPVGATTKGSDLVGRGTSRQEQTTDPFAESNRAPAAKSELVERAEKAFAERLYDRACSLYEQADRAAVKLTAACQERWAYCKLYLVAEALNKGSNGASLEGEVRQALRLSPSPKLETFGQGLLKRLREGETRQLAIKHTPRKGNGWALAETPHFRLFHVGKAETAEKLVRIAEAARGGMARKWFGEDSGDWSPRCEVYVHPTADSYAKATGRPTEEPGHSTFEFARGTGRVLSRRVHIRLDDPDVYTGTLRHEVTHVVLAGRFGKYDIPRWADEGIAVLSEPATRVKQHTAQLAGLRRERQLFTLAELFQQDGPPPARQLAAFYAQSVSLVDFLVKKKDEVTFTRFVKLALEKGMEAALTRYYGYKNVVDLERDWQAATFGDVVVAKKN